MGGFPLMQTTVSDMMMELQGQLSHTYTHRLTHTHRQPHTHTHTRSQHTHTLTTYTHAHTHAHAQFLLYFYNNSPMIFLLANTKKKTGDIFVGTRASNWCRMVDELRKANGKGRVPYLNPGRADAYLVEDK